jgi:hypothetical protein
MMVDEILNEERQRVTSQVWAGLGSEVRQQAIQLLAQLAVNLVVSQTGRPRSQEEDHAQRRVQS